LLAKDTTKGFNPGYITKSFATQKQTYYLLDRSVLFKEPVVILIHISTYDEYYSRRDGNIALYSTYSCRLLIFYEYNLI